jgi:hypothetical protein
MSGIHAHPLIDEVLDAWAPGLGRDAAAYRGHAQRVYHFALRLSPAAPQRGLLAVASAFHDLGIWSDKTFDYLAPSRARAEAFIAERMPELGATAAGALIENHHRLGSMGASDHAGAMDAFRKADWIDVSGGLYGASLDYAFVREVVAAFPYAGFHVMLVRTACRWCLRHPLRPLPMLRFGAVRRG